MTWTKRRRRVRLHLIDPPSQGPLYGGSLPSVEGILVHARPDFEIGVARLITGTDTKPIEMRTVVVPRERVAFYEIL